jgi:hypothetical protein
MVVMVGSGCGVAEGWGVGVAVGNGSGVAVVVATNGSTALVGTDVDSGREPTVILLS